MAECPQCAELKIQTLLLVCAGCGKPMGDTCAEALQKPPSEVIQRLRNAERRAERWKEAARVYRTALRHAHIAIKGTMAWRDFRRWWAQ